MPTCHSNFLFFFVTLAKSHEASPFKILDSPEHSRLQILEKSQSVSEQVREITINFEKKSIALDHV
jgi:hypothetical protein